MSPLLAILLGIIQGITEFLPVSSFGHLATVEKLFGAERQAGVLFEVMLHTGTLAAIFVFFWSDLKRIGEELLGMAMDLAGNLNLYIHNRRTGEHLHYAKIVYGTYRKFAALILVSSVPTAVLGYTCRRLAAKAAVSPLLPGICFLITGIFLLVTDLSQAGMNKTPKEAGYDSAMWMGICQGLSVFPGISREGMTICAGLLCGLSRKFAVKYSFIMSVPAVAGALVLELGQFASPGMTVGLGFTYILGMLTAAVTGFFTIRFLLVILQKTKLRYFAFYCFLAGIIALVINYR